MIWSIDHNLTLYLILAAALLALLVFEFSFGATRNARSKVLAALRMVALLVLLLILLNPSREEHTSRPGPQPTAVFLIDESRSMSLETPRSRSEAGRQLIKSAEGLMPRGKAPAIQKFGFGRELFAVPAPEETLSGVADESRLGRALQQLPARFGETLPFGVFVFSDGRATATEPLSSTARAFHELGVPVHVVPLGDERISGDVAVANIDAPRDARPGTRVPVRVTVRSRGHAGERTELKVRQDAGASRDVLATLPITLADGEQAHDLVIDADRAKGPLAVEVQAVPHEAIAANNVAAFQILPRQAKLRVIYMEGSPLPEYRYIHDALEEDPNITCVSMTTDNMHAEHPRLYRFSEPRLGYPRTREELLSYDLIICSDISRGAFTPQQLEWTVELVTKRGGGFVMIGGNRSFGSGGWDQTAWDGMIPVDMSEHGAQDSEFCVTAFKINIPPAVIEHPVWRIVDDPERNRQILARMPMFTGTNLTYRLKPAATVLGYSDRYLEQADITRAKLAKAPLPPERVRPRNADGTLVYPVIFSCQSFGRGRVFAMSTDSTWAWGTEFEREWGEGDNRYFRKFWRNVIYWLTENRGGSNRRLQVETDKVFYRPGQPIEVTARAYDQKLSETDAYHVVARLRSANENESQPFDDTAAALVPQLGDPTYRGKLTTPPLNKILENPDTTVHQVLLDVAALDGDAVEAQSTVAIQVIDDPAEFRDPRPDPARLEQLARATAGRVIRNPQELAAVLAAHPQATTTEVVNRSPLWDRPLLWLILLGVLSAEWIFRRMKGLA